MPSQPTAETVSPIEAPASDCVRPTYSDLTALAERIVAEFYARLQRFGEPVPSEVAAILLRHDIVLSLFDVRYKAATHAADRAWNAVHRSVLR